MCNVMYYYMIDKLGLILILLLNACFSDIILVIVY